MIKTCWVGGPPPKAPPTERHIPLLEILSTPMTVKTLSARTGYEASHVRHLLVRLHNRGKAKYTKIGKEKLWESV